MRLIDADKLTFDRLLDSICQGQAEDVVAEAPTIDAVPVVRCGECKHRTYCYSEVHITNTRQTIDTHKDIGYCSYGERKNDETD